MEHQRQENEPPRARRQPSVRRVHGVELVDEYAWLRNREDPAVIAHLEAENRFTEQAMAATAELREQLFREMIGRIDETDTSAPVPDHGWRYYVRTERGLQYPIHCRRRENQDGRDTADGGSPEEVLLDENELAAGFAYHRLGGFALSHDHTLLAFSVDNDGSERFTIQVKNLVTGSMLADRIPGAYYGLAWSADGGTLLYTVPDATMRPHRLVSHRIGADPGEDRILLQEDDKSFYVSVSTTRTRSLVLVGLASLTSSEVRIIPADAPDSPPRIVAPRRPQVRYGVTHHLGPRGERFFIRTNDGAKNFRVVESPAPPAPGSSPEHWTEVLPHRDDVVVEDVQAFADHLVVVERIGPVGDPDLGGGGEGLPQLRIQQLSTGQVHHVTFPEPAYTVWLGGNRQFDTGVLRFHYSSLVTPASDFDYDMSARTRILVKQEQVHGYDPSAWVSERLAAKATDGTAVPISLVRSRKTPRDGTSPLLLSGYGAYGASRDASFSPHRLSLLERGWTFAIAHVRGGGDLGERWHDEGKTAMKTNTFGDFIACAEHLVTEGYTSPDRLAMSGGSAGGLLVGAVLNMRPDLFGAAQAHVPFVDVLNTMLDPSLPLSVLEYEEWGDPRDPGDFHRIRSYSPYDNVARQAYPATLVTAGLNDPRVSYWEPAKWVARLRERKTDRNPLLLRTKMEAGHGGPSGRYEALEELAFDYAFLLEMVPRP